MIGGCSELPKVVTSTENLLFSTYPSKGGGEKEPAEKRPNKWRVETWLKEASELSSIVKSSVLSLYLL